MENTVFEVFMLILRVGLVLLLYFFIVLVVRVITREYNFAVRRPSTLAQPVSTANQYPEEDYAIRPQPNAPGQLRGRLVVTEIGNATTLQPGAVLPLQPVTPIGRRADNLIVLNDDFVSSEHALIALRDGQWWLSDVASTNGTLLNNEVIRQPIALKWGDLVGVGRVRMRLEP